MGSALACVAPEENPSPEERSPTKTSRTERVDHARSGTHAARSTHWIGPGLVALLAPETRYRRSTRTSSD